MRKNSKEGNLVARVLTIFISKSLTKLQEKMFTKSTATYLMGLKYKYTGTPDNRGCGSMSAALYTNMC